MNFREHAISGLAGSSIVCLASLSFMDDPEKIMIAGCMTFVGALAPDLDTHSKPSMMTAALLSIISLIAIIIKEPYPAFYFAAGFLFIKSFSHRTWIHTYTLPAIISILAFKFDLFYLYFLSIGIVIHYAVDRMNPFKFSNWNKFKIPGLLK